MHGINRNKDFIVGFIKQGEIQKLVIIVSMYTEVNNNINLAQIEVNNNISLKLVP